MTEDVHAAIERAFAKIDRYIKPEMRSEVPWSIDWIAGIVCLPPAGTVCDPRIFRSVGNSETDRDLSPLANAFNPKKNEYIARIVLIEADHYARTRWSVLGDQHVANLWGELRACVYLARIDRQMIKDFNAKTARLRASSRDLLPRHGWNMPRVVDTAIEAVLGWAAARRALTHVRSGAWQAPKTGRRPKDLRAIGVAKILASKYERLTGRKAGRSSFHPGAKDKNGEPVEGKPRGPFYILLADVFKAAGIDADPRAMIQHHIIR